jgi:hypothetical protein
VLPAVVPAIGRQETALDNLALAATNNTTVLQQLTAANLALMTTVSALTATNKKLVEAAARKGTPVAMPSGGGSCVAKHPFASNYSWTHGHCISKEHTSASCAHKAAGHHDAATASNTLGGSEKDKGWDAPRT